MRRILLSLTIALALPVTSGCAGIPAKQKAMAGAAVTATFVNGSHRVYSKELNSRLDNCDPAVNTKSKVTTKSEMDDCLGKGFDRKSHEAVGIALKSYEVAARAFEAAVSSDNPEQLAQSIEGLRAASFDLIALLPEGSKLAAQLKEMVKVWE